MAQNRFRAYLKERRWSDNLCDFVDHAVDDPNLPDAASWGQLEAYLKQKPTVVDKAIEDAKYVWQLYEANVFRKMN